MQKGAPPNMPRPVEASSTLHLVVGYVITCGYD